MARWVMRSALATGLLILGVPADAQVFHDDFDGTALDTTVWLAERGDGEIVVADGVATLSCRSGTFPVVTTRLDPFPPGDFLLRVGLRYLSVGGCGDGIGAVDNFWERYRGESVCRPFLLWHDFGGWYVYSGSLNHLLLGGGPETGYHVYEWLYTDGRYELSIDGVNVMSGDCAPRATGFFFGHPHPIVCGVPWTSFELDFVHIEPVVTTLAPGMSWGSLKARYRGDSGRE